MNEVISVYVETSQKREKFLLLSPIDTLEIALQRINLNVL